MGGAAFGFEWRTVVLSFLDLNSCSCSWGARPLFLKVVFLGVGVFLGRWGARAHSAPTAEDVSKNTTGLIQALYELGRHHSHLSRL
jgi:hypothetical protein